MHLAAACYLLPPKNIARPLHVQIIGVSSETQMQAMDGDALEEGELRKGGGHYFFTFSLSPRLWELWNEG